MQTRFSSKTSPASKKLDHQMKTVSEMAKFSSSKMAEFSSSEMAHSSYNHNCYMKTISQTRTIERRQKIIELLRQDGEWFQQTVRNLHPTFSLGDITQRATALPLLRGIDERHIHWVAHKLLNVTYLELIQILQTHQPRKLTPLEKPNHIVNIYDWFVESHTDQINLLLQRGTSIRSIVRQFNDAYSDNSNSEQGRVAIMTRIRRKGLLREPSKHWLNGQPRIEERIRNGEPAKSIYPTAQILGFTGSLRTFQRLARKSKAAI